MINAILDSNISFISEIIENYNQHAYMYMN